MFDDEFNHRTDLDDLSREISEVRDGVLDVKERVLDLEIASGERHAELMSELRPIKQRLDSIKLLLMFVAAGLAGVVWRLW
ncbi:hypothetical protein SYK_02610 [Pseudodesulfovibrio nedwellii]|uniref:DUF1640 domain-containing protein n=1 Tax=Pseudodesulfovibrio nedwellii TaxID=2973072 RepID=A0ABM8AWP5_9BACT|nr:hypothetical protein [Pseudodesulfovibrio nedwellii]BDQ35901.1 hypothetical protein SYK_02610 [Pseudodesulfovibrio nedwellii]